MRLRSQSWRDELANDPRIEGIAGEPYSAVAEQTLRAVSVTPHSGSHPQQREIASAAPKVADENQFIMVEGGFVGVRCGDRLHLKVDALEASERKCVTQSGDGE